MNEFWLIFGMMCVTVVTRYPVMAFFSKRPLPKQFQDALTYVPPAVLTAIIIPEVLAPDGAVVFSLASPAIIASLGAVGIAWRTRNLLATIVGGMALFWLWPLVVGLF